MIRKNVVSALSFAGFFFLLLTIGLRADEFDNLRLKWRDYLTGGTNLDVSDPAVQIRLQDIANAARSDWNTMNRTSSHPYLWPDAARPGVSGDISICYLRLRGMAMAWATRGSSLQGNAKLARDIVSGLDWMHDNRYNETILKYDNWWDWEIGAPQRLNDAAVLMFEALSDAQIRRYNTAVDKFSPSVSMTGANRSDKCLVLAIRGILGRDISKLTQAREGLSQVFPYVTRGDGFYRDGSFIQHTRVPYTVGYGVVLLEDVSRLMLLLSGSRWQVIDPARTNVIRWVYDSFQPVIYKGAAMNMLMGRAISRMNSLDHMAGDRNINAILQIARFAPPSDAAALKSMIKSWAQADTYRSYSNSVPLNLLAWTRELLVDTNIPPNREFVGHFQFPCMDRVVHLRPGFGFGISMCSSRICNFESLGCENLHGWFTGDGMTYLYNYDLGQFSAGFWPTVDPYHLPGTTVDTTARPDKSGESQTSSQNWVGGAALSSGFGVAGMSLAAWNSPLMAKKSWFMFDNEIVCLGAGITCASHSPVHTTIEDRRLLSTPTNSFMVDGNVMPASVGWSANLNSAVWCALAGSGGYYFPGGANLQAVREARTGSWWNINQCGLASGSVTNLLTEYYLKLWFNHGLQPSNAAYAYVLLPNLSSSAVAAYAAKPDVSILANSVIVQAVRESSLGIVAANFWTDGTNSADLITVDKKAAVITCETRNGLEVAISDPTHTNTSSVRVTLSRAATRQLAVDSGVTATQLTPYIQLSINVNGSLGKSFHATFSY